MKHYSELTSEVLKQLNIKTIKTNRKEEFLNVECGFDIETTSTYIDGEKVAFSYIWCFGIGSTGEHIYYGRTWEEFIELCDLLTETFQLFDNKKLVCYVHNFGYEFQFMRKHLNWKTVFAVNERKPIKALSFHNIEFRDSYILSGYSLGNTAKNLQYHEVEKLTGDLDYSLVRTHETPMSEQELKYVEYDVLIILYYINEQIKLSGDISKIPLTNTGRVRSFVRHNCYYTNKSHKKSNQGKYMRYRKIMNELQLESKDYEQLKRSFMGGFTHANAYYSGKTLENVSSVDFGSSYPSVMITEKFPMSKPIPVKVKDDKHFKSLLSEYALLFEIRLEGVQSKIGQENYISESKCYTLENPIINNGRVHKADILEMTITDIDFKIIEQAYTWENIIIGNVKKFYKDYLPKPIIESILELYQGKTELKGVEGKEVEYMLSKGMLNSVYGMSVTDIIKDNHKYEGDEWLLEEVNKDDEIKKHNKSKNRFLYYAWGVWVTAYARYNLWTGILALGDDYVYSDTDSIKLLNYNEHLEYFEKYDTILKKRQLQMMTHYNLNPNLLSPETIQGHKKHIGVWDFEGTHTQFKTLGAKRYLENDNGNLTLTVAGLSKQNGLNYMIEKAKGNVSEVFEMFDNELYIPSDRTGKMTHTYIDDEMTFSVTDYKGNETEITTLSGIHLEPTDFTLSISKQYGEFINQLMNGFIFGGVKYE